MRRGLERLLGPTGHVVMADLLERDEFLSLSLCGTPGGRIVVPSFPTTSHFEIWEKRAMPRVACE